MTTAKDKDATGADKAKADGKHIPAAPSKDEAKADAVRTQAATDAAIAEAAPGTPGIDPGAGSYSFESAQADEANLHARDKDQHSAVLAPMPEPGDDDGVTWIDEQVALGRRIAVTTAGEGGTITREEVLPSNATSAQVNATKERLRKRLVAE